MEKSPTRRQLFVLGGTTVGGLAVYGVAAQEENGFERTVEWAGQGSEHATQDCPDGNGSWHWVLTPGGPTTIETDAELVVEFDSGPAETTQGYRPGAGGGAVHFAVTRSGGGIVDSARAHFNGGGDNVILTISDGECIDDDEPPENGKDEPPENGKDEPPENGKDEPPENGKDEPPENGKDIPPENGNDEPPENGEDDAKSKKEKRKEKAREETKTNCNYD